MKKQELRRDLFREKVVKGIQYFNDNSGTVIKIFIVVVLAVSGISYYNHIGTVKIENAAHLAGRAQNIFINGKLDEALIKFKRVLNDYPKTPGAMQSLVYLMSDAVKNNNLDEVSRLLLENNGSIQDPVLLSSFLSLSGDLSHANGDYYNALKFYKNAQKVTSENVVKYKMNMAFVYISQENYNDALQILIKIIENDDIGFNEKNTAEELMAYTIQKMDI